MRTLVLGIILSLCLVGCGAAATTPTPPPATAETAEPTAVAAATDTAPVATTEPAPTTEPTSAPTTEPTEAASATAEATVAVESGELPVPPDTLVGASEWLATALAMRATPDQIREVLVSSGWLMFNDDLRDIAIRGEDEAPLWLIRLVRPAREGEPGNAWGQAGRVYIADPEAGKILYEAAGQDAGLSNDDAFDPAPTVLTDTDFTGDGIVDAFFEFTTCGASTCVQEYHVVSTQNSSTPQDIILATGYNTQGNIVDDLPFVQMSYSEAYLGDDQGDSIIDLQLVGGTQGSVGAGPQRSRSETYGWDGEHLTLFETTYEETDLRYFKLLDANIAFDKSDYETALALYQEAATSEALQPSGWYENPEQETDAIKRYATFRVVVTSIILEDYIGAQRIAEEFVAAYPDDAVAAAALQVVMTYAETSSLADACAEATAALSGQAPDLMTPLNDMGYSNPALSAETVCPVQD